MALREFSRVERPELEAKLEDAMRSYYQHYYKDQLGLIDWETRTKIRLIEEKNLGEPKVSQVEDWLQIEFKGFRVLVVGAGTGAETMVLHRHGAEVHAIEPSTEGCAILRMKASLEGITSDRIHKAPAEKIPYSDNAFDFVFCYTVLEHVQDIEKSVDEMIRVCKVGGTIFIQTLDFRFPYDPHYKSDRIPFSPRWLTQIQFWLQRKPVSFLRTVNFVTTPQLDKIFMRRNVLTMRINPPLLRGRTDNRKRFPLRYWFLETFGIPRDQNIFLRKLGD